MSKLSKDIFKAYDIRGIVGKTLTNDVARQIGQAIGSEAKARKVKSIVVGRDGRLSGPELCQALAEGIRPPASTWSTWAASPRRCCISPPMSWARCPA